MEAASSLGVSLRGGVSVRSSVSAPPSPPEALRLPRSMPASPFALPSASRVVKMRSGLEEDIFLSRRSCCSPRRAALGSRCMAGRGAGERAAFSPARSPLLPLPALR
ncbi:UNVERIFIED_CONTAM: hypothetical protein FKN15_054350 [Acipenser sinensis]